MRISLIALALIAFIAYSPGSHCQNVVFDVILPLNPFENGFNTSDGFSSIFFPANEARRGIQIAQDEVNRAAGSGALSGGAQLEINIINLAVEDFAIGINNITNRVLFGQSLGVLFPLGTEATGAFVATFDSLGGFGLGPNVVPIIGPFTGETGLYTDSDTNPLSFCNLTVNGGETCFNPTGGFNRGIIAIQPSYSDELAAVVDHSSRVLQLSRYTLVDREAAPQTDPLTTLLSAIGNRINNHVIANVTIDDDWPLNLFLPILDGNPEVVILAGLAPQQAGAIIVFIRNTIQNPNIAIYVLSNSGVYLAPSLVSSASGNLSTSEAELAFTNTYLVSQFPTDTNISGANGTLLGEFNVAKTNCPSCTNLLSTFGFFPVNGSDQLTPVYPSTLNGYAAVKFLGRVLSAMPAGPPSRADIIDAFYETPFLVVADDFRLGVYLDDCGVSGPYGCCNSGVRSTFINEVDISTALGQCPDNCTTSLRPVEEFSWDTCQALTTDINAPFVFGVSLPRTGGTEDGLTDIAGELENGLLAAFAFENEADSFNGRELRLLAVDDFNDPNTTESNVNDLITLDNVLGLVGFLDSSFLSGNVVLNNTVPVIGTIIGDGALRNPDPFITNYVNLFVDSNEEVAASMSFLAGQGETSNILIWYDPAQVSGDVTPLQAAQDAAGLISGISQSDVSEWIAGSSTPSEPDVLIVVSPHNRQTMSALINDTATQWDPSNVLYVFVSELLPEEVAVLAGEQGVTRMRFVQDLPPLDDDGATSRRRRQNTDAPGKQYRDQLATYNVANNLAIAPTFAGYKGWLLGKFLARIIQSINGEVTRDRILETVYTVERFSVTQLDVGAFLTDCLEEDAADDDVCCNQGLTTVYFTEPSLGVNSTVNFTSSTPLESGVECGFGIAEPISGGGDDDDGLDTGGIIGIVFGGLGLLLCCFIIILIIAFCIILVLLIAAGGAGFAAFSGGSDGGFKLVEPDYTKIVFTEQLVQQGEAISRLLVLLPLKTEKQIKAMLTQFENFLLDDFGVLVFEGIRMGVDELTAVSSQFVFLFDHNDAGMDLMTKAIEFDMNSDETEQAVLFRIDSVTSKFWKPFSMLKGVPYLWNVLALEMHKLKQALEQGDRAQIKKRNTDSSVAMTSGAGTIELDPKRMKNNTGQQHGQLMVAAATLKLHAQKLLLELMKFEFPHELRTVLGEMIDQVVDQFGDGPHVHHVLSAFVFLRYICLAVTNPQQYGIFDQPCETGMLRSLILLSKVLQNLANGLLFVKEEYMLTMNDFVSENKDDVHDWLHVIPLTDALDGDMDDELIKIDNVVQVPDNVAKACLRNLFATCIENKDNVCEMLKENLSEQEFKKCSLDFLIPLGLLDESAKADAFEESTVKPVAKYQDSEDEDGNELEALDYDSEQTTEESSSDDSSDDSSSEESSSSDDSSSE